MNKKHLTGMLALGAAVSLVLTGCAGGSGDKGDAGGDGGDTKGSITMGFLPAWTDGLSTAYLLADQLEKLGYDIEMEEVVDAGPLYTVLAKGDIDMYPSAWSEVTHASYMAEYGDKIEDLGTYYDGAVLTLAVPDYMENINSIEDLKGNADLFDGKIIGIEPGAGLTDVTQSKAMPEYGLDGEYELVTSSTGGMLATLDTAVAAQEPIVVTLWRPFWANDAWPMKDLKDPKGAMGQSEGLHFLGKLGFAEQFPEAADFISQIKLTDEQYGALESLVTSDEYKNKYDEAVDKWIAEYSDELDWLITK